ncbi:hypothetical protein BC567DRAFT_231941 [Phyllosticta citribraziliensis]
MTLLPRSRQALDEQGLCEPTLGPSSPAKMGACRAAPTLDSQHIPPVAPTQLPSGRLAKSVQIIRAGKAEVRDRLHVESRGLGEACWSFLRHSPSSSIHHRKPAPSSHRKKVPPAASVSTRQATSAGHVARDVREWSCLAVLMAVCRRRGASKQDSVHWMRQRGKGYEVCNKCCRRFPHDP